MTQSVNDIPDAELLRRAMASIPRVRPNAPVGVGRPLWDAVSDRFGLGSTYSGQLCRRFGLDPDERVRR